MDIESYTRIAVLRKFVSQTSNFIASSSSRISKLSVSIDVSAMIDGDFLFKTWQESGIVNGEWFDVHEGRYRVAREYIYLDFHLTARRLKSSVQRTSSGIFIQDRS